MGHGRRHSALGRLRPRRKDGPDGVAAIEWHLVHPLFNLGVQLDEARSLPVGVTGRHPADWRLRWRRRELYGHMASVRWHVVHHLLVAWERRGQLPYLP